MNSKVMISERGKKLLIVDNNKFYKVCTVKTTGEVCWRCTTRKCTARLFTMDEDGAVFSQFKDSHNHKNMEDNVLTRHIISNSVKRKASEQGFSQKPSKMIHLEISSSAGASNVLTTKDVTYIKNVLSQNKLKVLPKLPKSTSEVHQYLAEITVLSTQDENMVLINDPSTNIIVFSCESNLQFLCNQEVLYMDGTFEYCTKHFLQLFTIFAIVEDTYVPLAFSLLKDKKANTYVNLLYSLKEKCREKNLILSPSAVIIDFEKAIHSAIFTCLPATQIIGCRFHLTQAWWRKIQQLGLSVLYKDQESQTGKWLKHIFGLVFLDPEEVGDAFVFDFAEERPSDPRLLEFSDYLVENYISEESQFPPHIWAKNSASLTRTTNCCESFHAKLKHY